MKELRVSANDNPADDCIEACTWCELACLAAAETCLNELQDEQLALCVQLSLDCAEVCWTTRKFVADALVVAPHLVREQLDSCALVCAACAAECRRHSETSDQLATCERTCARCEQLCRDMHRRVTKLD
ncbi:MAG: four-helix bundle copper-binding protein [Polyangiales bacterium]